MKKGKDEIKLKLNGHCLVIYDHINFVEQTILLIEPVHFKNLDKTPLINIIIKLFSFMIVNYTSKIIEHESRGSGCIFFLRNYINSNISDLSDGDTEYEKKLLEASSRIDLLKENFPDIIDHFGNFKDKAISHIDKAYAKKAKILKLAYNPGNTLEMVREIRAILRLLMNNEINESYKLSEELRGDFNKMLDMFGVDYKK